MFPACAGMDRWWPRRPGPWRSVFPACAGMDRDSRGARHRRRACSPRARGWTDVPQIFFPGPRRVPRVRGDGPDANEVLVQHGRVFPACAGMDRNRHARTPRRRSCSPRARGWTDQLARRADLSARVPRVRGDGPMVGKIITIKRGVFPACAGMDRRGLPCRPSMYPCSPRARGWTVESNNNPKAIGVFPACAGMDRTGPARGRSGSSCSPRARGWTVHGGGARCHSGRVPRVRGDGPTHRGLTGRVLAVFPACAGMDRRCCPAPAPRSTCSPRARGWTGEGADTMTTADRVPRVRGDGPDGVEPTQWLSAVFPACAGMDRRKRSPKRGAHWCSPRARGWTDQGRDEVTRESVFPACAGMDRHARAAAVAGGGVPRVRGDGPIGDIIRITAGRCSPRARGWTERSSIS